MSGDGGYNEVVNGALLAQEQTGHQPTCCIMAAGNANDHRRSVKKQPLSRAIVKAEPEAVDILKMTVKYGSTTNVRYAHSYIGFGFTSHVADELNPARLTRLKEIGIVLRAFFNFEPTLIAMPEGRIRKVDSLVFANIHQMAKMVRIGKKTNLHNGQFKMVFFPHQTRLKFIINLLRTTIFGVRKPIQQQAFTCALPKTTLIHLDGEVQTIPGGSQVIIESAAGGLQTVR